MLILDFYNKTKERISKNMFGKYLRCADKILTNKKILPPARDFLVELTLTGNSAIQKINKKYRGREKPTDVISLSYFNEKTVDIFAGEIFICIPFARRQAKNLGYDLKRELAFLFIHGLLHVFGFNHATVAQAQKMDKLTDLIVSVSLRKQPHRF